MHRERLAFLTSAAALVLAASFIGTARPAAQETQGTPSSAPAVEGREEGGAREPQAARESDESRQSTEGQAPEGTGRAGVALQPGSTAPPRNLKKVGDHWTPYDPPDPESFPPDATLHIIVPGDTLWDLADLVFGNPYLWPQVWNENRYILDSHWIYPGDPLLLPARPTVVGEIVPQGQEGAPPAAPTAPVAAATGPEAEPAETSEEAPAAEMPDVAASAPPAGTPAAQGSDTAHAARTVVKLGMLTDDYDLRCSGFIAPRESKPEYFIANQEEEGKLGLTEGDIVYLNRGQSNGHTETGTEYSVVVREGEVRHPMTHRFMGYYYKRLGAVKILAAQETTSIAAISYACDEIRTGHALVPFIITPVPPKPVPAFNRLTMVPPDKSTGYVIHVADSQERASTGQLVDIDLGYEDGLKPGDYLTVFLPSEPFDKFPKVKYSYAVRNRRFQSRPIWRDDNDNLPPAKTIGQMVVVFTEKKTATAKILQSVREIEIGDSIVVY
ncbi:MAG: LysM peptidoglycan-binding domain-containing protein [Acidobacteria bacterium]|nr:LysM peptidoglycan-binding domain-containing protein [Acidobacteriota bacterium]